MTWVAATVISGGAALLSSGISAGASKSAAETQLEGTKYASDIQKEMFDILNKQQAPYREIGKQALTNISDLLPYFTRQATAADIQSMPGYQFGLQQGLGAVSQGANVLSPGTNVDIARQKFGSDYALTTALPAFLNQRTGIYNTLAGIAGLGQTATQSSGNLGMQTAGNIGQLAVGGAGAAAAGQIGAANAISGGIQGAGNAGFLYSMMNQQNPSPSYSGYAPTPAGAPLDINLA